MQVLWLYGNNITWIEAGAFSNLRVLEELDLGDNPSLRILEGGAFRGLEKLQSLHMHRCKLAALPHDLFHKLYSLQFLYLQVKTESRKQYFRILPLLLNMRWNYCVFMLFFLYVVKFLNIPNNILHILNEHSIVFHNNLPWNI